MHMIKVGSTYVNMDNVTSIEPVSQEYAGEVGIIIQINFAGQTDNERSMWIESDEAPLFLKWLDRWTTDVMNVETAQALAQKITDYHGH